MLRCPTQLLDGRCWLLSQPGKSCASTCEREKDVDLQWMHLARIQEVALSLEQLYGFQATNAEDLRQPCAGNSMAAVWYTFVPFRGGYTGRWQCSRASPPSLRRLTCACKGPWIFPALPPPTPLLVGVTISVPMRADGGWHYGLANWFVCPEQLDAWGPECAADKT